MSLRYPYKMSYRKLRGTFGPGGGPLARITRLRMVVTSLIRHERIETTWNKAAEARDYAELLIQRAIKNGDKHGPTMELADFWLLEKDLIHKLFKVFVPRFEKCPTAFTKMYRLPYVYPGKGREMGLLELKGNPWPPVLPEAIDKSKHINNVLLNAARQDFRMEQYKSMDMSSDRWHKESVSQMSAAMDTVAKGSGLEETVTDTESLLSDEIREEKEAQEMRELQRKIDSLKNRGKKKHRDEDDDDDDDGTYV
ncbi:39S ribosomal protein L17, mitochondrial-like [Lingula anatina]|uniref:Large ribosomal subunit protein bL17m n=1 Tax=Lingula anatina TaxID=7574 RepID=A0A1S3I7I9_LINAN|nr:39S ribosomal protein L17, mitochondrial-like [Lingula anatina]|eukprot:XP_013394168.1 39S ribosomal protein L17, mitochondrial-like [Lingula anatina]